MHQNYKYLGITLSLIGILAGLSVTACLLFGLTGWFLFKASANLFAGVPENKPVVLSMPSPFVLPGLASAGIPNGWKQFKTRRVEIWLPAAFTAGDPTLFSDTANSATPEMLMAGASSPSSLYKMFVMVSYEPLTADSLDAYLEGEIVASHSGVRVAEKKKVSINSRDAVRFVFETRSNNTEINDLAYLFLDGSTVWYVEYVMQSNEFFEMLPTFEDSVRTFRVVADQSK
jgi:hypothetical protein